MDTVSKEEFFDWKQNNVTRAVFAVIDERITDAKDILGNNAGDDPTADRYLVGMIRAFNEIKQIDYED